MKYFVDTERISLDYSEDRMINDLPVYRMTLYDKYGHFESDVYMSEEQIKDLIEGLEKIKEQKLN